MVDTLIDHLRALCQQLPDPRRGANTQFTFDDIVMAAFSVFFIQSPSFLDHQRKFQEAHNRNACQSLFGIRRLPSDNHIRQQLDGIAPERLYPAFDYALQQLMQHQTLAKFQPLPERSLIVFDGSQFHESKKVHCSFCSTRTKDNLTSYHHDVLCAIVAAPGHNQVIPLPPEFITPQDGADKQDCELNAAKRWLSCHHRRYQPLKPIYVGDDLYGKEPLCRQILAQGDDFLFVAKPTSHQALYDYLDGLVLPSKEVMVRKAGGKTEIRRYRWAHGMPLRDDEQALQVNWLSIDIIRQKDQKTTYRNTFITSLDINRDNVDVLAACGRSRWKIENESFNLLKNNGYHMEHNFGHGKHGLTNVLLTLNLIAFAFHTACDLLCELWQKARARFSRRHRFFVTLDVLNNYLYFENWRALLLAVCRPRPPP